MASPTVTGRTTYVSSTTNATSWTPLSAVTVDPGELLLFICSSDGVPTLSTSSPGWQKLDQASDGTSAVTGAVFVCLPDDNKAATTTLVIGSTASEQYSGVLYRIRGADSVDFGAAATGSSTNSNPPSNTVPVSARDILAIATRSGDSTTVATVAPANYTNLQSQAGGGTSGVSTNSAERALAATATEDPGTFTSATEQWVSYTILLYQSDAVANGQTIANNANTTVTYRGGSVYEVEKTSGAAAYDAGAVSSVGLTGDFVLRVRPLIYTNDALVGVNSDPLTNNDYASIDRAFNIGPITTFQVFESGIQWVAATAIATYLWIWRTGATLGYGTGATLATAQASPARTVTDSSTLYFDSAFFATGTRHEVLLYEVVAQPVGTAAGSSAVAGAGRVIGGGSATSAGAGATVAVGRATGTGAGASTGAATPSGTGSATIRAAGSSSGSAAASGVGLSGLSGTGASAGASGATGATATIGSGAGSATSSAAVFGVGDSQVSSEGIGTAAGVASADGSGAARCVSPGTASGLATLTSIGGALADTTGSAGGASAAAGAGTALWISLGTANGFSVALGIGGGFGNLPVPRSRTTSAQPRISTAAVGARRTTFASAIRTTSSPQ